MVKRFEEKSKFTKFFDFSSKFDANHTPGLSVHLCQSVRYGQTVVPLCLYSSEKQVLELEKVREFSKKKVRETLEK